MLCNIQIVTLIESQWLIIPPELQYSYYVEADDGRGIKVMKKVGTLSFINKINIVMFKLFFSVI